MTVGADRQHAGNSGYDDQPDVYYSWDSTVSNHRNIREGDVVVLWDKKQLLGMSVVEQIETGTSSKQVFRCPNHACGRSSIKIRKTKTPRYKCQRCKYEFDRPVTEVIEIVEYRSRHDAAWTSLEGLVPGKVLRTLCDSPKSQLSMRSLNWSLFEEELITRGDDAVRAIQRVLGRSPISRQGTVGSMLGIAQGHRQAVVRVRRGQGGFRKHLLSAQGAICAFTGAAPDRVLDAGHLYSYGKLGQHWEHGGLLLRRDIHRLFDDGWLAVDPSTMRVDVADYLARFPQYAKLHDRSLEVRLRDEQVEWLEKHWVEHRATP